MAMILHVAYAGAREDLYVCLDPLPQAQRVDWGPVISCLFPQCIGACGVGYKAVSAAISAGNMPKCRPVGLATAGCLEGELETVDESMATIICAVADCPVVTMDVDTQRETPLHVPGPPQAAQPSQQTISEPG